MLISLVLAAATLLLIGSGSRSPKLALQPIRTTRKR
jgi:hypothetical protein